MEALVACNEALAAQAGRQILERGGNVADAAIATAYAQAVVAPFMCGLSGKASIHVRDAARDLDVVLDAGHTVGALATPTVFADRLVARIEQVGAFRVEDHANAVGYQSIMTPGFVPGTRELFARFGSGELTWATLLAPAVALASEGFGVDAMLAHYWSPAYRDAQQLNPLQRLLLFPAAAEIYLTAQGEGYHAGERFRQPDLARTLERIAGEGPDVFISGDLGQQIATDFERNGAFVTYEDMASFPVEVREPLRGSYRGRTITANPLPGNGIVALLMLQILDGYDLARLGYHSPAYIEVVAKAMYAAFLDRSQHRGDPRHVQDHSERLLSQQHAQSWRDRIDRDALPGWPTRVLDVGTTHLTVMDAAGNAVTMTHSIGSAAGSGSVTPGTGVLHNNHMTLLDPRPGSVDSIVPGRRGGGSVPLIVYEDGEPVLALGGAGGTRQVTATVQVLLNVLDHGMEVDEAVAAPRFHCEQPARVLVDPCLLGTADPALRPLGYEVVSSPAMGRVAAVRRAPDGGLTGGSDLRPVAGIGPVGYARSAR